jgi:hypothetical protein
LAEEDGFPAQVGDKVTIVTDEGGEFIGYGLKGRHQCGFRQSENLQETDDGVVGEDQESPR